MMKHKKRRADLAVPEWVKGQWDKGAAEKDEMADLLLRHNGSKDLLTLPVFQVAFLRNKRCFAF